MSKIVAIGDIHGRYEELCMLIAKLVSGEDIPGGGVDPNRDVFVFLGDYIDRGPQSPQVISALREWRKMYPHWVFLMGNHDEFLAFSNTQGMPENNYTWGMNGGFDTLESYKQEYPHFWPTAMNRDATWLRQLPYYHEIGPYVFVHAGVRSGRTMQQQAKHDLAWIRREFLTNPFPLGMDRVIVHGHTPTYAAYKRGGAINLCTTNGAYGSISAAILEEDRPTAYPELVHYDLPENWPHTARGSLWEPK